tara:strand:- start:102 stop:1202 length:1101 start_codon:yes stop_codon:yes gene_type:complete
MSFYGPNYLKLRKTLEESWESKTALHGILKKQRAGEELTDTESGQLRMVYDMFGYDEVQYYERQLFYATGKYPELDDMLSAGKYLDDDVLTSMFNRKIDSVIDDFAVRADALKGRKNPNDEAMVLIDEFLEYDIPELLKDRKSLNDIIRPLDDNGVDPQGKLDVLTDALGQIQYREDLSPEYLAHNLRGMKAHVNTLPQAQKVHKKKSGTADDTEFWDEEISYEEGEFTAPEKKDLDMVFDAGFSQYRGNIVKEGRYTPVDLPVDTTYTTSEGFMPVANPRQQGDFSEIDAAGQKLKEQLGDVEAKRSTSTRTRSFYPEDHTGLDKKADSITAEIEAEIARLKKKKTGGIIKKAGGGFMGGPLYDD